MGRYPDPTTPYGRCRVAVAENPLITPADLAALVGISPQRASKFMGLIRMKAAQIEARAKAKQAAQVILKDARAAVRNIKAAPTSPAPTEADVERIKLMALDPATRINMMAEIAARGKDEVALRALAQIHEWQLQAGAIQTLPPISTADERITRAARVLASLTPDEAKRAWTLAFEAMQAPTEDEAPEDLPTDAEAVH